MAVCFCLTDGVKSSCQPALSSIAESTALPPGVPPGVLPVVPGVAPGVWVLGTCAAPRRDDVTSGDVIAGTGAVERLVNDAEVITFHISQA